MSKDRTPSLAPSPSLTPPAPPLRGEGIQGGEPSSPFTKGEGTIAGRYAWVVRTPFLAFPLVMGKGLREP